MLSAAIAQCLVRRERYMAKAVKEQIKAQRNQGREAKEMLVASIYATAAL